MADYNLGRAHGRIDIDASGAERGFATAEQAERRFADGSKDAEKSHDRHTAALSRLAHSAATVVVVMKALKFPVIVAGANLAAQGIMVLVGALAALAGAIGPVVGLLGTLPGALAAVGQGFGTVKLAFGGVGDALKSMGKASAGAGGAGVSAAKAAAAAAKQTEAANERVHDSIRAVQRAYRQFADSVQAARDRVVDAIEGLTRAQEDAAERIESANRRVEDAQRRQTDALRQAAEAQKALTQARVDAVQRLQDLQRALERNSLSEERAVLALQDAERDLQLIQADRHATARQRKEAELRYKEAAFQLKDIKARSAETAEEFAKASQEGVDGNERVIAALEAVSAAQRNVADANRDAALAAKEVSKAEIEGRRDVLAAQKELAAANKDLVQTQIDGQENIAEAERDLARAYRDAADAAKDAGTAGGGAISDMQAKLDALSPAARRFVEFLFSLKPRLDELRATAAAGLFPGLETAITKLLPMFPLINSAVGATASKLGELAVRGAELLASGPFQADLATIAGRNITLLDSLGTVALNFADALRHIIIAAGPLLQHLADLAVAWSGQVRDQLAAGRESGRLGEFFKKTGEIIDRLLSIAGNLIGTFTNIGKAGADLGNDLLASFDRITAGWKKWTGSDEGQTKMKEFFDSIRPALHEIGDLIRDIALGFGEMSKQSGLAETIKQVRTELLPAILDFAKGNSQAFTTNLVTLATNFVKVLSTLSGQSGPLTTFVGVLGDLFGVLAKVFANETVAKVVALMTTLKVGKSVLGGAWKLTGLQGLVTAVSKFKEFGGVAEVVTRLRGAFGGLLAGLSTLKAGFSSLFTFLAANPFILIIAAVIALVIIIVKNWDTIKAATLAVWNWIKDFLGGLWDGIKAAAGVVFDALKAYFEFVFNLYKTIIMAVWDFISGFLSGVWNGIKDVATTIWDAVKAYFEFVFNFYKTLITGIWNGIRDFLSAVWNTIKSVATTVWNSIKDFLSGLWNGIKETASRVFDAMSTALSRVWNGIKDAVGSAFGWVRDKIKEAIEKAADYVRIAIDKIKGFFTDMWNGIKGIVEKVSNGFEKLAFWRNSPSLLEINAEKTVEGVIRAFKALDAKSLGLTPTVGISAGRAAGAFTSNPTPSTSTPVAPLTKTINLGGINVTSVRPEHVAKPIVDEVSWELLGVD